MGEVYRAYDERLARWVAVKQVRPDRAVDERARDRFRREARAVAGLAHPAVVQIFDFLDVGDECWIVMEWVDGKLLADLARAGPLDVPVVVSIGRQIAEGLAHAHKMGIVHRDLKVENVMLSADGRARILDFGLVKNLKEPEGGLTEDGAIVGTIRAMSPEQASGQAVDSRTDLFSLGTLLYECLAGMSPFEGSSAAVTLHRVVSGAQKPLSEINSEAPPELSNLIDWLLVKHREGRPSVQTLVHELQRLERSLVSAYSISVADLVTSFPVSPSEMEMDVALAATTLGDSTGMNAEVGSLGEVESSGAPLQGIRKWLGPVLLIMLLVTWSVWQVPESRLPLPNWASGDQHQAYLEGIDLVNRLDRPGDLDRAVNLFTSLAAEDPRSASIQAALAKAKWLKYRVTLDQAWLEGALAASQVAVEKGEYLALAHASLANVYLEQGRFEESLDSYESALRLDPTCADAYWGVGMLHEHHGETDQAEKAYRRALEVQPDNRLTYDALGTLLFKSARLDEAKAAFERSIELAPASVFGYANLAGVYFMRDEMDQAAAILQQGLEVRPHSYLYTNLGSIFFFQGKYEESIQPFRRALELDHGSLDPTMWANLGDAYRWTPGFEDEMKKAYQEAVDLVEASIAKKPSDPELQSQLAVYLARMGEWDKALAIADRLEEREDIGPTVLYTLALTYEQSGSREKALVALERALELDLPLEVVEREQELDRLRTVSSYELLVERLKERQEEKTLQGAERGSGRS